MFLFSAIWNRFMGSDKKDALQAMKDEKSRLEVELKALEEMKVKIKTFIASQ